MVCEGLLWTQRYARGTERHAQQPTRFGGDFELRELGPLRLKGIGEVAAWRLNRRLD